jgi:hypothetical protein
MALGFSVWWDEELQTGQNEMKKSTGRFVKLRQS